MLAVAMKVIKPYSPLFQTTNKVFILSGGRDSGKSKALAQAVVAYIISHPNRDIIVGRDTQSSISSSVYSEIQSVISEEGLDSLFTFGLSPQKITRGGKSGSTIHFLGIGGADLSRTRSYKTKNPVGLLIFEELQQVRSQENFEQAMASFRRLLDPNDWRVLIAYNPPSQAAHWINIWTSLHEHESDYIRIHTTYKDVWNFLSEFDRREILLKRKTDPEGFKNMYLGIACGGLGSVYPMFKRETMFITPDVAQQMLLKNGRNPIRGIVIGGDGAVNRDNTSFVPLAIFNDGRGLVLDIFDYDPKENGVIGSSKMMTYLRIWFDRLCDKYGLKDPLYSIPIMFNIDCAATDLINEVAYEFGNEAIVRSCYKQTIPQMVSVVQSALSRNAIYILDIPTKNYYKNTYVAGNPLVTQLESLVWKKNPNGLTNLTYDPIIPNDTSDAFTYAILGYYRNPDNLPWGVTEQTIPYFDPIIEERRAN